MPCRQLKFQSRLNHGKLFKAPCHNLFSTRKEEASFKAFTCILHLSFSFPRLTAQTRAHACQYPATVYLSLHTVHIYNKSLQVDTVLTVTAKPYIKLWTLSSHIRLFCQQHILRITSCWSWITMSKYVLVSSFCYWKIHFKLASTLDEWKIPKYKFSFIAS